MPLSQPSPSSPPPPLPFLAVYGLMLLAFALAAVWLALDLSSGRDRIIDERSRLATQKSQFMSQWFGTTILTADYVLRDVLGRVNTVDLVYPDPDLDRARRIRALLAEKTASLPGIIDMTVYNHDCIFTAAARRKVDGFKSNQIFCTNPEAPVSPDTYVQYMPAEKSASRRPVILISRNLVSPEGRLLGGALAVLEVDYAQKWIAAFGVDPNDVLAMVDIQGTLLARNPPMPDAIGTVTPPPPGQPAFGSARTSASFVAVSPLDGRERIFGVSKIEQIPVAVIVGFDKDNALAEWHKRAWQLSAGFVVLLMAALMMMRAHLTTLRQREEMRKLATTDALTGIANRRHLVDRGRQEVGRARRYAHGLAAMILDIDKFKTINDSWGHPTGDRAIQALARTMQAAIRDQDTVGRLGGEEFAMILPETDLAGAMVIAERLRAAVAEEIAVSADDGGFIRFTVSIGVAALGDMDGDFEDLLTRADQALYRAKETGRNRVVAAG